MKLVIKNLEVPKGVLNRLDIVPLSNKNKQILDRVNRSSQGPRYWRDRKTEEARELLALEQISKGRFSVKEIDSTESFRAIIFMEAPLPLRPDSNEELRVAKDVLFGLTYRKEAVILPQPGFSFVQILSPNNLWHANIGRPDQGQPLCLGLRLPAAIPVKEIVLMTYGALTMQTVMVDEEDPAGVLNQEAAKWWQQNLDKVPLSREPFIRTNFSNSETG